jgi:hypothetical protein
MFKIVEVRPLPQFRLWLKFADGVTGEVDLSGLAGQGVFAVWNEPGAFDSVRLGSRGEVCWNDDIDLCPDALYLEVTGQTPEQVFPMLAEAASNAGA